VFSTLPCYIVDNNGDFFKENEKEKGGHTGLAGRVLSIETDETQRDTPTISLKVADRFIFTIYIVLSRTHMHVLHAKHSVGSFRCLPVMVTSGQTR
jgi:hypothetical protein